MQKCRFLDHQKILYKTHIKFKFNINDLVAKSESQFASVPFQNEEFKHKIGIFRTGKCGNNFGLTQKNSKKWIGYFCLLDYEVENEIESSVFIEICDSNKEWIINEKCSEYIPMINSKN